MTSSSRELALEALLDRVGLAGAPRVPLAGDASTRRYERVLAPDRALVLMDAPPKSESAPCPPGASAAERAALGYNAMARLAASRVDAFVAIASHLKSIGLSAPTVIEFDPSAGFALIEDLGDALFAPEIAKGLAETPLYEAAIDALAFLHEFPPPARLDVGGDLRPWHLMTYDPVALHAEADLLLDWYAERFLARTFDLEARAGWAQAWAESFEALEGFRPVLVLRDFHAENLIWLPDRKGPQRAGLLDFQDALVGHPAYDLVSLLTDARRDVDPGLASAMLHRYLDRAGIADRPRFVQAAAVLGAQRNAKIVGIFARLALRDGKARYLAYLPRVLAHLKRDLAAPALLPVARWFETHLPPRDWQTERR